MYDEFDWSHEHKISDLEKLSEKDLKAAIIFGKIIAAYDLSENDIKFLLTSLLFTIHFYSQSPQQTTLGFGVY